MAYRQVHACKTVNLATTEERSRQRQAALACAMRTKQSGMQDRRVRSARYAECANVVWCD